MKERLEQREQQRLQEEQQRLQEEQQRQDQLQSEVAGILSSPQSDSAKTDADLAPVEVEEPEALVDLDKYVLAKSGGTWCL
jgi:hypothetical protein